MIKFLDDRPHAMKWRKYGDDVLPLWVADMDIACPQVVSDALIEWASIGDMGYELAREQATEAVQRWLHQEHEIESAQITWQAGVVAGFNAALASVCQLGDHVVVPTPTYPPMLQAPALQATKLIEHALFFDGTRWQFDLDLLAEQLSNSKCKALLISNPMNPTGQCISNSQLGDIVKLCNRYNILLISDEIHCDLVLQGKHYSALHYSGELESLVVLMAASKTFNIAGLATSYMICPNPTLRKRVINAGRGIAGHANNAGVIATNAAYRGGKPWLEDIKQLLTSNYQILQEWQQSHPAITSYPVNATYLSWMNWEKITDKPYRNLLKYGVALSDGTPFGAPKWLRLNFACNPDTLSRALSRMDQAIKAMQP